MDFLREAFRGGNRFVLRLALIAALGGFLFGYDTGVISGWAADAISRRRTTIIAGGIYVAALRINRTGIAKLERETRPAAGG